MAIGGTQKRFKDYSTPPKKKPTTPISMDYMPGSVTSVVGGPSMGSQEFIKQFQSQSPSSSMPQTINRGGGSAGNVSSAVQSPSWADTVSAAATNTASNVGGGFGGGTGIDEDLTGWARGLKPDMLESLMYGNPEAFLRQILDKMGMDPDQNIGALMAASPYIKNMNELALVMLGANPDFETGSWNDIFNWAGDFASQGMKPGGDMLDFSQGLGNLLGAATGGDSMNPLESYLNINDPQGQVDAMMSLAAPLAASALHPLWASSFINEMSRQGDAWVSKNAGNNMSGAFNTFFKDRMGY